jgi:AAA-like domain/CHAT domain
MTTSNTAAQTILFLAANPKGTAPRRLDQELRDVSDGLQRVKKCDQFKLEQRSAVRPCDIQRAMLDLEPKIVHFSGHGEGEAGLVFEDEIGNAKLVDGDALAALFKLFADKLTCVVLNGCYSEVQAQAIAQHITYVIGMNTAISDKAAITFAVGFYDALGAGRDVNFAYKLGCAAIRMEGIPEHLIPKLLVKDITMRKQSLEENCDQKILQPGALIRIKAPEKMGKSRLLDQILTYSREQNYQTVRLDLQLLEDEVIKDSSQFLRWLCKRVSRQLKLEDRVDEYWQGMTPNILCTDYFEEYILSSLDTPLVLGLDNVDRIFSEKYETVAQNFFGMLRAWWGNAQQTTGCCWKNLRIIVVYSTEDLPKLNIYQSPFNVGLEIKLPELNFFQVQALTEQNGLNLLHEEIEQMMELVGGHPYLLCKAFNYLKTNLDFTINELLIKAVTDEGIYSGYLQEHWLALDEDSELAAIFKAVVTSDNAISIDTPKKLYKLESMGLIRQEGNKIKPSCQLYRVYFREHLRNLP